MIIPSARVDLLYDSIEVLIGSLIFEFNLTEEQHKKIEDEIKRLQIKAIIVPPLPRDLIGVWKLRNNEFAKITHYSSEQKIFIGLIYSQTGDNRPAKWLVNGNNESNSDWDLMKKRRCEEDRTEDWPQL